MLSNDDLLAISILLDKKLESVKKDISDDMNGFRDDLNGLKNDVNGLKNDVNGLKNDVNGLKNDVNGLKNDMNCLRNDMDCLRNDMESGFQKINMTLENNVLPRLQNIESCYTTTYKRYQAGVNQIETMQVDIDIMKDVVSDLSERVQKLENVS